MNNSGCIILSDVAVHHILINLSKDDITAFLNNIAESLRDFSAAGQRSYQPEPAVVNHSDGRKILFRAFTSSTGVGTKIIVHPSPMSMGEQIPSPVEKKTLMSLHGVLTLCDCNGLPSGFVNAEEITGYRTSLSAMVLYVRRQATSNVVIFGAGKQALWHARLALGLRGNEIERITFVNRSVDRALSLIKKLAQENEAIWKAKVDFDGIKSSNEAVLDKVLDKVLGQADVIFCTTASTQVLFPARSLITSGKSCYVSAIGSWQPDMIELDPELLRHAARRDHSSGIVVVDDRKECLTSAGEVIRSGLREDNIAELGELLASTSKRQVEPPYDLTRCLETGLVLYKSVGVSITDLAAGQAVLALAKQQKKGSWVEEF